MTEIILREELSKSRRGKHAIRYIALIVSSQGEVKEPKPIKREVTKPVYSRGKAYNLYLRLREDEYGVQVRLVRNIHGKVLGSIEVYDNQGRLLFRAVYRKLKLRYSKGNPRYSWIVELVARHLKLPLKRINLSPPSRR